MKSCVIWLALLLLLSACGGGGSDTSPAASPTTPSTPSPPVSPPADPPVTLPVSLRVVAPAQVDIGAQFPLGFDLDVSRTALTVSWDFGDGSSSTLPQPVHAYAARGSYLVTLTVRNAAGSALSAQATVQAFPPVTSVDEVRFVDALHGHFSANDGMVLLTSDGGLSWRRSVPPGVSSHVVVRFADVMNGWAIAGGEATPLATVPMFRSDDGGRTWMQVADAPVRSLIGMWVLAEQVIVVTGGSVSSGEPVTMITADAGRSWRGAALAVSEVTPGGVLIERRYGGGIRVSTDMGLTAQHVFDVPASTFAWATDFDDWPRASIMLANPLDAKPYTSPAEPALYVTDDGGLHWARETIALPPGTSVSSFGVSSQAPNWASAYMPGPNDTVGRELLLRSVDGGRHWSPFDFPASWGELHGGQFAGEIIDATSQWRWSNLGPLLTIDAGEHWVPIIIAGESAELLSIRPAGSGVIFASYGTWEYSNSIPLLPRNPRVARRYVSSNGGSSWHPLPGGEPMPMP